MWVGSLFSPSQENVLSVILVAFLCVLVRDHDHFLVHLGCEAVVVGNDVIMSWSCGWMELHVHGGVVSIAQFCWCHDSFSRIAISKRDPQCRYASKLLNHCFMLHVFVVLACVCLTQRAF